jgi:polysaccharide biosynthesis/export protein
MRILALIFGVWLAGGSLVAAEAVAGSKGQTNSPSSEQLSINQLDDKTKLNTGDIFTFRVIEDKDPPTQRYITDTGEMEVPYVGRFKAAGKTCKQLAEELKVLLEKDYYYKATVIISIDQIGGISQKQINILGAVNRAGPVNIPPGMENQFTLSKAINAAGGVNTFGNETKIKVTRKSASGAGAPEEFTIDLKEVLKKGQTEKDIVMKPGDIVEVPKRWVRFF